MIWPIIFLAIFLRIINLNQSLWLDEAVNIVYAKSSTFWWFVTKYSTGDFHPPGWFAILWIWGHIFNFSEVSSRLPSVIFAALTVFLTYLIGRSLFSKSVGLMAVVFLSLAPLHIYYSQEARMYSFAAFSVTLSSYFLIKLIKKEKGAIIVYAFSVFLVLYSDYIAYFALAAQFLFVLFYSRTMFKKYILSLCLGLLSIIPWLFIFPAQLKKGLELSGSVKGWSDVVGGVGIKETVLLPVKILIGRVSFENRSLYFIFVFITGLTDFIILIKGILVQGKNITFLLFWLLIPPIIAIFISFWIPVFSYFRFIFILPAFYLLLGFGVSKFGRFSKAFFVVIILSEVLFSSMYLSQKQYQREDWKDAVKFVNENANNNDLVIFKNQEILAPLLYYQRSGIHVIPAFNKTPVLSSNDFNSLKAQTLGFEKIYLFDYLVDVYDPGRFLEKELFNLGYKLNNQQNFRGVGLINIYIK